ncbi:MAG: TIGR03545 family protein, partial [Gammaproteobacteria bacterium]|nr:TIGR03545 family protein [Gammaproteobacteria bacterium]
MNAIRWPGFIAFLVFIIIITGGCWLFAESIAESIAESTLTDLNGAKVDIESVDLKYSPLSITINDIQVTDPDKPMTNMLQIGRASFALSFGDLLLKKLVIDEMAINKIQVDTPRKKSGAVKKLVTEKKTAKPADDSAIDFIIPDLDLPDVDDILNREKLQSESLVTDLNQDLETTQDNWDRISKDINNQQRWNEYQSRYNKIKQDFKGDTQSKLAALKDAKALKDDLNREKTSIQKARKQFSEDNRRLSDKFKAVKQAPGDDVKRLREKYGIGNMDAQNITQLLF